jgi:FtsZ-interacting cell division protein ZipA
MSWPVRLGLLALMLASYWGTYQHGRSVERSQALAASAQRDSDDRLAEVQGERAARYEEQRRAQAQEEARTHAHEQHQVADAGAAGADAAGQRLQHDAAQLAATVSCPGPDSAAVARGQAATRAAMVLSDLLARADARAGELAKAYDRARIAGEQCAREYDALVKHAGVRP